MSSPDDNPTGPPGHYHFYGPRSPRRDPIPQHLSSLSARSHSRVIARRQRRLQLQRRQRPGRSMPIPHSKKRGVPEGWSSDEEPPKKKVKIEVGFEVEALEENEVGDGGGAMVHPRVEGEWASLQLQAEEGDGVRVLDELELEGGHGSSDSEDSFGISAPAMPMPLPGETTSPSPVPIKAPPPSPQVLIESNEETSDLDFGGIVVPVIAPPQAVHQAAPIVARTIYPWSLLSLLLLLFLHCLQTFPAPAIFHTPEPFHAVDWNARAITIELSLASIPRLILFGNLNPTPISDTSALSHRLSKTAPPIPSTPEYHPWETTSNGIFIPESTFLHDLDLITSTTCRFLRSLSQQPSSCLQIPSISHTCDELFATLVDMSWNSDYETKLARHDVYVSVRRNILMMHNLGYLQGLHEEGGEELGSDVDRVRGLYQRSVTVDIAGVQTGAGGEGTTDKRTEGVPEAYIQAWVQEMARQALERADEASSSTSRSSTAPKPTSFSAAQASNTTAKHLLFHIDLTLSQAILTPNNDHMDSIHIKFAEHAARVSKLHTSILRLQTALNVLTSSSASCVVDDWTSRVLTRLSDTTLFLSVAVQRISEMNRRAQKGMAILTHAETQQAALRDEIHTLQSQNFTSSNKLHHFPSLPSIALDIAFAGARIVAEAQQVRDFFMEREMAFWTRYKTPPAEMGLSDREVKEWREWYEQTVWTRWGDGDRRDRPDGEESFCWTDEVEREHYRGVEKKGGWFGMWKGKGKEGRPRWCGDASRRHG